MNGVRLVIVVPCYNEEEVLKETTRQLSDVLARMEQEGKVARRKDFVCGRRKQGYYLETDRAIV